MSTRKSIKSSRHPRINFHLYEEAGDYENVYLELDANCIEKTGDGAVVVRLRLDIWESIKHHNALKNLEKYELTDQEIKLHVTNEVETRIESYANGSKFAAFIGAAVYGDINDPKEIQIERGVNSMKKMRQILWDMKENLKEM